MWRSLRSWPTWAWCCAVVAVEAIVVLGVLGQSAAGILGGDGPSYDLLAGNLLHHGAFSLSEAAPWTPTVYRSPGYPALLLMLHLAGLGSVVGVRIAQFAVVAVLAVVVGRVAREVGGPRAERPAALLAATYLPLLWLATQHMTEVVASAVLCGAVWALVRAATPRGWAIAGALLAAAVYVRPSLLLLAAPVAVALVVSTRRWTAGAAFLAALVVAIAPWMARNGALIGGVLPMSSASGGSQWISAEQWTGRLPMELTGRDWVPIKEQTRAVTRPYRLAPGGFTPRRQVAADAAFASLARWDDVGVGDVARRLPARLFALWGPVDQTPTGERWTDSLRRLLWLQWALLVALTACGLWLRRSRVWAEWPLWLPAVYLTALHLVFHVEPRYSIPARPLLLVYATVGVLALADRRAAARASSLEHAAGGPRIVGGPVAQSVRAADS